MWPGVDFDLQEQFTTVEERKWVQIFCDSAEAA
jgi:hypothetical protein